MASDIVVGIAVLAAAKKDDHLKREEQARQRDEERRQRELLLRKQHIAERRHTALDEILEELAALNRLRGLVVGLQAERMTSTGERVTKFLALAELRIADRENSLSAGGLEQRFENQRLFGEDDDYAFRPPYAHY